jgi:nitroreductase
MEFSHVIQIRQSVRTFRSDQISEEILQQIFSSLVCAPSAGNLQAYEVLVLRDRVLKEQVGEATTACYEPIHEAPLALVFVANAFRSGLKYQERGINLFCIQDATIAATYAMLAATNLGLASLWVGGFNNSQVSSLLRLRQGLWPVVIMPVGYPNEIPERPNRRSIQDVVHELA